MKLVATIAAGGLMWMSSCQYFNSKTLPVIDAPIIVESGDTLYPGYDKFSLLNQDSLLVTEKLVKGKVSVADFFFCSCPSICPRMKTQMLRVYEKYKQNEKVKLISFSIDPQRDSVQRLKTYSQKLGVPDSRIWHFLTGEKELIYKMAERLMIYASPDEDAPGGYAHNGKFVLIDANGKIRGYYEGTDEKNVTQLLSDMDILLKE